MVSDVCRAALSFVESAKDMILQNIIEYLGLQVRLPGLLAKTAQIWLYPKQELTNQVDI